MRTITIYPFPFSSKRNKYTELIYKNIPGKTQGEFRFEVKDSQNSFLRLFKDRPSDMAIIHIHWENIIYGSKFILKSIFLMLINGSILLWLKNRNFKIVWTMHNFYGHDYPHPLIDKMGRKFMFAIADAIIIQEDKVVREMKEKYRNKKIIYIPHVNYIDAYGPRKLSGSEIRNKLGFNSEDIILLSLGAIKPYKKIESVIEVFNSSKLDQRIKLLIAGYGDKDYCRRLEQLIGRNKSIKLQCRFVEEKEISEYLGMADYSVFWYDNSVLTSGGIALSISYGVPVIARNIPAAEVVRDGVNGYLYADERGLGKILSDLPNKSRMNFEEIIKTVSGRSSEYIADRLTSLYKDLWN